MAKESYFEESITCQHCVRVIPAVSIRLPTLGYHEPAIFTVMEHTVQGR